MNLRLCDFCGGEMRREERAAVLTISTGRRDRDDDFNPFAALMGRGGGGDESWEMCAACLGHLLPVTERIRQAKLDAAKQNATRSASTLSSRELLTLMKQLGAHGGEPK